MVSRDSTIYPVTKFTVGGVWDGMKGNYDQTSLAKECIVLHTIVGTIAGANSVFNNVNKKTSANYGIGLDGKKYQWVSEKYTAYANNNYVVNQRAISIEHEDNWSGPPAIEPERTDALYKSSAELVADICKFYDIPCTREFIKKHSEVSVTPTACPDHLDVDRIVREANALLHPVVSNPTSSNVDPLQKQKADNFQKVCTFLGIDALLADAGQRVIDRYIEAKTSPSEIITGSGDSVVLIKPDSSSTPLPQPNPEVANWLTSVINWFKKEKTGAVK